MDIAVNRKSAGTLIFLVLGLVVLGAGLVLLTWQNLKQQEMHVREQLEITARAIARSVKANLYRGLFRSMGPGRWNQDSEAVQLVSDVLKDLVQGSDVVFVDIYSARGRIFISREEHEAEPFVPTQEMMDSAMQGSWTGRTEYLGQEVFVVGLPVRPPVMRSMMGRRYAREMHHADEPGQVFIALDMTSHMDVYTGFRRTIILQAVFVLAAVLVIWFLMLAVIRKRDEQKKYAQLKTFHSTLLDNMPDGLLSVDSRGIVTAANPAASAILSREASLVGQNLQEIMPAGFDVQQEQAWMETILNDRNLEIMFLPMAKEKDALVLIRDRTRMKKLEKDLEHARDLATLGRFAAGLAHEIRNPLSSLRGFAQYFMHKFEENDPARAYAQTMVRESDRLNRVVSHLLYLARPRAVHPAEISLPALFQELEVLLGADLKENNCTLIMKPTAEKVRADSDLLKQALINLLLNSMEALKTGGGKIILGSTQTADSVCISAADNGPGMDEDTRARAMEPFFSTRDKGTGLGLAIVHRIVRDHKGSMEIISEPGSGTEVRLCFPQGEK